MIPRGDREGRRVSKNQKLQARAFVRPQDIKNLVKEKVNGKGSLINIEKQEMAEDQAPTITRIKASFKKCRGDVTKGKKSRSKGFFGAH